MCAALQQFVIAKWAAKDVDIKVESLHGMSIRHMAEYTVA